MTLTKIAFLVGIALSLAVGNTLFKSAAIRLARGVGFFQVLLSAANIFMLLALIVYAGATISWVYALRDLPLQSSISVFIVEFCIHSYIKLGRVRRTDND